MVLMVYFLQIYENLGFLYFLKKVFYNMENFSVQVLDKIRKMRDLKGIKQEDMALFLGISQQAYSKLETGESELSLQKLEKITEKLEISLQTLLDFSPHNIFQNNQLKNKNPTQNIYQSPAFSPHEKTLYEKVIENLEKENARLAQTVEALLKKA